MANQRQTYRLFSTEQPLAVEAPLVHCCANWRFMKEKVRHEHRGSLAYKLADPSLSYWPNPKLTLRPLPTRWENKAAGLAPLWRVTGSESRNPRRRKRLR